MFAPPRTASSIVTRLVAEVRTVVHEPGVRDKLAGISLVPDARPPADFAAFLAKVIKSYTEAVRVAGIEPQ
jgi:tripartite-type tricarboxylate transporter receptor subunit TctC